ncbi:heme exporter protein CcmD [Petrachloros mirabilis]
MMYWNSVDEFLAMGGYGLYVWTSFGATALCMAVEVWAIRHRFKTLCDVSRAVELTGQEQE